MKLPFKGNLKPSFKLFKNIGIAIFFVITIVGNLLNFFQKPKPDATIVFYDTNESTALTSSVNSDDYSDKIVLNKASAEELLKLPGIGETKANAIIEYRNEYGEFKAIDELTEVKGIGSSTLEKIRPYLVLN